MSHDRAPEFSY